MIESTPEGPGFVATGTKDSRYVLEGRDMLFGDCLYGFSPEGKTPVF